MRRQFIFKMRNFNQRIITNIFRNSINHFCCIFYIILEKLKDCSTCLVSNLTFLRKEWRYCNYTIQFSSFSKYAYIILQLFLDISQKCPIRFIKTYSIGVVCIVCVRFYIACKKSPRTCFLLGMKIYTRHLNP